MKRFGTSITTKLALRAAIAPYAGPQGVVMQSSSWTITARKPRA